MSETGGAVVRAEVVSGGVPSPAQAAALAATLLRSGASGTARSATPDRTGWRTAALLEAVGAARITERAELRERSGPVRGEEERR